MWNLFTILEAVDGRQQKWTQVRHFLHDRE